MSAGKFETAKYQATTGTNIFPCRAQPETKELTLNSVANDYPAGAITAGLPRIRLRKGKRQFGVTVRTVTVKLTEDGTGATEDYKEDTTHVVPVFQPSVHAGYAIGQTGTYLGIACECIGKFPE